jgi:tetratricopeptide (TPR) repeat protein
MIFLALFTRAPAGRAADALVDAKRRAAAELMKDGKAADAVAMLREVVQSDPAQYKDHLQLARAYDRLSRHADAAEAYHRAADLLATAKFDDRPAKAEIDRRLKVLDAQTSKVVAAEDEFLKKLDALERDAIAARDTRAVERIFRLRGGVWAAQGRKDAMGIEIAANSDWKGGAMEVQEGVTYRVRAAGTWTLYTGVRCTPDGTDTLPANHWGAIGGLMAAVSGDGRFQWVGSNGVFTAPTSGRLVLICNVNSPAEQARNDGSVFVIAVHQ